MKFESLFQIFKERKNELFIIKVIISSTLIAFLLWSCNLQSIISELHSVSLISLIPVVFLYIVTLFLLSLRWRYLLCSMNYKISINESFLAFSAGILLSDVSPGRIGDMTRPYFVRDHIPITVGLASVILDRYCDFIGKIIFCGLSVLLFSSLFPQEMTIIFIIISIIPVFLLSMSWIYMEKGLTFLNRPSLQRIHQFGSEIHSSLKRLTNPKLILPAATMWTIFIAFMHGFRLILLAEILGYSLPIVDITILQSLISSLALVPITLSGIGLVEGGLTAVFSSYGIPLATGVTIAVLDRMITVCVHIICGAWYVIKK
ncbi:lysylphosphatidylglycerol synthase transmembrane domain-containing protein [Methanospirillum sp.]